MTVTAGRVFGLCLVCWFVVAGFRPGSATAQQQPANPLRSEWGGAASATAARRDEAVKPAVAVSEAPKKLEQRRGNSAKQVASYGFPPPPTNTRRSTRRQQAVNGLYVVADGEPEPIISPEAISGEIQFEVEPMMVDDCGNCGTAGCTNCCLIPCPRISWENLEFFGGVHGFTGPVNRGQTGSFGFHEGINWGAAFPCFFAGAFGLQLGAQATQSNLSGAEFTNETRKQVFVTGGIFRRVDWGMQGGVVVDFLRDDWYLENDLVQIRGEISWVNPCFHELGFWFTAGTQESTGESTISVPGVEGTVQRTVEETWRATDLYAFFYRRHFDDCGARGRLFAGFTGDRDGLIGGDIALPLSPRWVMETEFTYLIPNESRGAGGQMEESWNVGFNLVWYPGCRPVRANDYYRPLFDVANNGSFLVDRK